jgi:hypothetical protein
MSVRHRDTDRREIDRREAERLLRDSASGSVTDPDPLVRLLATAAHPGPEAGPSTGEENALAAFRMAWAASARAPEPVVRRGLVGLLTAKTAAALMATAIGGVALAAGAAHLPDRRPRADRPPASTPAETRPATPPTGTAPTATSTPPFAAPTPPSAMPTPASVPPSSAGLCRAYERSRRDGGLDKALDGPAFAALTRAAGGEKEVAGYCATLLRPARAKSPAPGPKGQVGRPPAKPNPSEKRSAGRPAHPRR